MTGHEPEEVHVFDRRPQFVMPETSGEAVIGIARAHTCDTRFMMHANASATTNCHSRCPGRCLLKFDVRDGK